MPGEPLLVEPKDIDGEASVLLQIVEHRGTPNTATSPAAIE
jgi:hypothetical protein